MGYLDDIAAWTDGEVARRRETRSLAVALAEPGLSIIAEVKRRSPSHGTISADADPVAVAKAYEAAGARAISVLTCARDFGGSLIDLERVRQEVSVPLLAKDFYVSTWQVYEARTHGADAILVIMAIASDELAADLQQAAEDLDMEVLCEVHDEDDLRRALSLGFPIIGVNARNLQTLELDSAYARTLIRSVPKGYAVVAESGIDTRSGAAAARDAGAHGALVGTALMQNPGLLTDLVGL